MLRMAWVAGEEYGGVLAAHSARVRMTANSCVCPAGEDRRMPLALNEWKGSATCAMRERWREVAASRIGKVEGHYPATLG